MKPTFTNDYSVLVHPQILEAIIKYSNDAYTYSIDENCELVESGNCEFFPDNFLYFFLSYNKSNNNYNLITDKNDIINCNINSSIIPNITFSDSDSVSISQISSTNIANIKTETTYIIPSIELLSNTIPYSIKSTLIVPLSTLLFINSTISSIGQIPFSSNTNLY